MEEDEEQFSTDSDDKHHNAEDEPNSVLTVMTRVTTLKMNQTTKRWRYTV
jgi:hypothetical protein